jgi:hypothetical protein
MATGWQSIARQLTGSGDVFINYRHDDAPGEAGRVFDRLNERFPGRVFRDVAGITAGTNFVERIEHELTSCRAFLVLIGKHWLDAVDESGRRRLDLPEDWVRVEIATALQRGICVIPVLVNGAELPKAERLPPDLARLVFLQAENLPEAYFDFGVERLVSVLEPHIGKAQKRPTEKAAKHWGRRILLTAAGLMVLLFVMSKYQEQGQKSPAADQPQPIPSQTPASPQASAIDLRVPNVPGALPTPSLPQQVDTSYAAAAVGTVGYFLALADAAEIDAYQTGDANRAALIYQGKALRELTESIALFHQQGVIRQPVLHIDQSYYILPIRAVRPGYWEVDACEYWSERRFKALTGEIVVPEGPPSLLPQTITIQQVGLQAFVVIDTKHFSPPGFCTR